MKRWKKSSTTCAGIVNWRGPVRYVLSVTENVSRMLTRKNLFWCPNDHWTAKNVSEEMLCIKCNTKMTRVGEIND